MASLVVSVMVFSLLLKFTTALLGVPTMVWSIISGGIVLLLGINLLYPVIWEKIMLKTGLSTTANKMMGHSQQQSGVKKDILLGAALGPVFNSCSPTYALIIAAVLPVSFLTGLGYLAAYSLGLGIILLLISIFGRVLVVKLKWASNPNGLFQKILGIIFVLVGIFVIFGIDKKVQTFVLENGLYDPIMRIEESLRR